MELMDTASAQAGAFDSETAGHYEAFRRFQG
jgi:hypothetical protein